MAHIKTKNSGRHWTEEDIDYVLNNYANTNLEKMAKHLGRTETAIQRKIEKLIGSRRRSYCEGFFSTQEMGEILGVSKSTVARWIKEHGFPATVVQKKNAEGNKNNQYIYLINPDNVWKWVKNNRDKMNVYAGKIQRGAILPEPKWLLKDIEDNVWYGRHEEWTREMLATLYKYRFIDGLKLRECADKFGKSLPAIQKQMKKINNMKMSELKQLIQLTKVA